MSIILHTRVRVKSFSKISSNFFARSFLDKTAIIHPSAKIAEDAIIGPYTVIGENVTIGHRTRVISNAHIEFAEIGDDCTISPFATNLTRSRNKECTLGLNALIAPVFYGDRLEMTFLASISQISDRYSPYATNISSLMLAVSLLQKAREWEHELEWRAIANACPYGTGVQYCKMRPDALYLGISMQEDERLRAIEVARQNGWRVYQMEKSPNSLDWALDDKRIC